MAPIAMAVLALAGCAPLGARPFVARAADEALAARVESALNGDPRLFARHIDVEVEAGRVYLSGYVWSTDDLFAAPRIAAAVPGVAGVSNELELKIGGRNGR